MVVEYCCKRGSSPVQDNLGKCTDLLNLQAYLHPTKPKQNWSVTISIPLFVHIMRVVSTDEGGKRVKLIQRGQWLRAAILGANDGLLSTTSLMLGVGAAKDSNQGLMIISGIAGAIAGACSMAVGEFVSVSTQREIEQSTNTITNSKAHEPSKTNDSTNQESVPVVENGSLVMFSPPRSPFMKIVARDARVQEQVKDDDDDGEEMLPNPYKAAGASGLSFLCGSLVPILSAMVFSQGKIIRIVGIVIMTTIALAVFGAVGAFLGGSPVRVSAMRVLVGGWISMAVTYGLLTSLDREKKHDTD